MWCESCLPEVGSSLMPNHLPRSPKGLHFTGSLKSLAPERPSSASSVLGQERPKRPPAPPPSRSSPRLEPARLATIRGQLGPDDDDDDEDMLTNAIDRTALDAALFPVARRAIPGAISVAIPGS